MAGIDGYTTVAKAKSVGVSSPPKTSTTTTQAKSSGYAATATAAKAATPVTTFQPYAAFNPAPAVAPVVKPSGVAAAAASPAVVPYQAPAAAPSPVPSQVPQGPAPASPTSFDPKVLNQLLSSLEARYGLSREELLADQTEIGNLYRFLNSNLNNLERQAVAGEQENAIGRGVLRSGIYLENNARVEQDFAGRRSQNEAEKAQKLGFIQKQLAQLEAELQAEKSGSAIGFGNEALGYERQRADARL